MPSQEPNLDQPSLRSLIGHSVLTALCPLIPIPFLDDWIRDVVRRRMVRGLSAETNTPLSDRRIDILACGYDPISASGCLSGCLVKAFKIPAQFVFKLLFKKILRKIVFVLAIKDSVDTFSATFHEGFLLRHALTHEPIRKSFLDPSLSNPETPSSDSDPVIALRRSIETVRDEVDHRPVERWARKTFTVSKKLLRRVASTAFRQLRRSRRDGHLDEDQIYEEMRKEEAELSHVVDELTHEIGGEQTYLRDLQRRLNEHLGVASTANDAEDSKPAPAQSTETSETSDSPGPDSPGPDSSGPDSPGSHEAKERNDLNS